MTSDELREICALTAELTNVRQKECPHLCIENFSPRLFGDLLREYLAATTVPRDGIHAAPDASRSAQ